MKNVFISSNARIALYATLLFSSTAGCSFARQLFAASQKPSSSDYAEKKFASALLPPLANVPAPLPPLVKGKPGRYRMVALPSKFEANAINNKGEIAGTWSAGDKRIDGISVAVTQAAVWKNRHLMIFPYTTDQPMCEGKAISDLSCLGGAAGLTLTDPISFQYDAVYWRVPLTHAGNSAPVTAARIAPVYLGHLPNLSCAHLLGINQRNQAIGWGTGMGVGERIPEGDYTDVTGEELGGTVGFYWDGRTMHALGDASAVYGINERGQAVGTSENRITLWRENKRRFFGAGRAFAISNRGWIVGEKEIGGVKNNGRDWPLRHAFVYQGAGTVREIVPLPGDSINKARAVNDRGEVVGASFRLIEKTTPTARAFLWQSGKMYELTPLIPKRSGWVLYDARSINNKGWIVGEGAVHGVTRSFLLVPK